MVNQFIQWFESKTRVYLYPRFVLSTGILLLVLGLFLIAFFISHSYTESVKTVGPMNEKEQAEYDARMRAGLPMNPPQGKEKK